MIAPAPIRVAGTVRTTNAANLRQGSPSTSAPILRTLSPGTTVTVTSIVAGTPVQGNALWYGIADSSYLWSGACTPFQPAKAPPPALASLLPAIPAVIDLYHRNTVTDFGAARAAGVIGVIHKATTGATGRDPLYRDRRAAAKKAGLLWGAYHWGTALPAARQVDNFLTHAQPDDSTLVALDYELDPGNQMTLDGARAFLTRVFEKLGRRPVLYSGHLIKEQLGERVDPFFGQHRLWLAQYSNVPVLQPSWKRWWLWQYSDGPAQIPGIPGDGAGAVDRNHFGGTAEQLAAEWAG